MKIKKYLIEMCIMYLIDNMSRYYHASLILNNINIPLYNNLHSQRSYICSIIDLSIPHTFPLPIAYLPRVHPLIFPTSPRDISVAILRNCYKNGIPSALYWCV